MSCWGYDTRINEVKSCLPAPSRLLGLSVYIRNDFSSAGFFASKTPCFVSVQGDAAHSTANP